MKQLQTFADFLVIDGPQNEPTITYIHTDGQTGTLVSLFSVVEYSSFKLTCNNSNGRPPPSYRWTGAGSSMTEVLNVIYIKRSPRPYHVYTCVVENTMINTCGDRRPRNSSLSHNVRVDVLCKYNYQLRFVMSD